MPEGEETLEPWEEFVMNPLYTGTDAGVQTWLLNQAFDHFIFAVKCNLAARIFEYSGSDYYGELFPLLARIFATADRVAEQGGDKIGTDTSLMVVQIKALVEATSTAVQMPMLVDLGRKSLLDGPTNVISGPAFFTSTSAEYVDFGDFASVSKTSLYRDYLTIESEIIDEITADPAGLEAETGIAITDESLIRKLPFLIMTAVSADSDMTPTEKKIQEIAAFVTKKATERYYNWFSPKVQDTLEQVFSYYSLSQPILDIMVATAQNWVIREGTAAATSEENGITFVTGMSERTY